MSDVTTLQNAVYAALEALTKLKKEFEALGAAYRKLQLENQELHDQLTQFSKGEVHDSGKQTN